MTIGFSCRIYEDPLSRTLGLVTYEIFMHYTCVFSYHDSCTQICTHFYAGLICDGQSLCVRRLTSSAAHESMPRSRLQGQGSEPSPTRNWPGYKDCKLLLTACASTSCQMRQVSFTSRSENPVFLFCISVLV